MLKLGHNKLKVKFVRPKRKRSVSPIAKCFEPTVKPTAINNEPLPSQNKSNIVVALRFLIFMLVCIVTRLKFDLLDRDAKISDLQKLCKTLRQKNIVLENRLRRAKMFDEPILNFDRYVKSDADVKFFTGIPTIAVFNRLHEICSKYVLRKWKGKKQISKIKLLHEDKTH